MKEKNQKRGIVYSPGKKKWNAEPRHRPSDGGGEKKQAGTCMSMGSLLSLRRRGGEALGRQKDVKPAKGGMRRDELRGLRTGKGALFQSFSGKGEGGMSKYPPEAGGSPQVGKRQVCKKDQTIPEHVFVVAEKKNERVIRGLHHPRKLGKEAVMWKRRRKA